MTRQAAKTVALLQSLAEAGCLEGIGALCGLKKINCRPQPSGSFSFPSNALHHLALPGHYIFHFALLWPPLLISNNPMYCTFKKHKSANEHRHE